MLALDGVVPCEDSDDDDDDDERLSLVDLARVLMYRSWTDCIVFMYRSWTDCIVFMYFVVTSASARILAALRLHMLV